MAGDSDLYEAFDSALTVTRRERAAGMTSLDGSSAAGYLDQLERELLAERERASSAEPSTKTGFRKLCVG